MADILLWFTAACRVWVDVYIQAWMNVCSWLYESNTCERLKAEASKVTPFWPLRYLLQTLQHKLICSAINRLISLIGARVCMFQSLEHFGHTLALASWVLSQADPFLPKLSGVSSCFVFNAAVLILVPSPLACSFCLSAGDICSACQRPFTRVPCLLLSGHSVLLCCSAALLMQSSTEMQCICQYFLLIFVIICWLIFGLVLPPPFPFFTLIHFYIHKKPETWWNCLEDV